jgi:hypothetical protein
LARRLPAIACGPRRAFAADGGMGSSAPGIRAGQGAAPLPKPIQTSNPRRHADVRGAVGSRRAGQRPAPHPPVGTSKWQTVHAVPGASLYRIAFDDAGRLLAWWEKEPHLHLFDPRTNAHETFPLPPPPRRSSSTATGRGHVLHQDGDGAIVYMHGFIGGRTWVTVAYHYDLARRTAPTLLFRQPGHVLHTSSRVGGPRHPEEAGRRLRAQLLPSARRVIAWEISGQRRRSGSCSTATHARRTCPASSRVVVGRRRRAGRRAGRRAPAEGATSCDGAGATPARPFAPLPPGPGPMSDAETMSAHGLGRRRRGVVDRRARPRRSAAIPRTAR